MTDQVSTNDLAEVFTDLGEGEYELVVEIRPFRFALFVQRVPGALPNDPSDRALLKNWWHIVRLCIRNRAMARALHQEISEGSSLHT